MTATNADGKNQALSAATGAVAELGTAPANTTAESFRHSLGGPDVKVDDGNWSGDKPITFGYQWQSCGITTTICADIAGATGSSFLIGTTQVGTKLRATVTATNSVGKTSVTSNLTAAVLAKLGAPVSIGLPAISGTTSVGQRLHASTGVWSGGAANSSATSGVAVTRTAAAARTSRARPGRATASVRLTSAWRSA